jgi:ribosomal protein S18 acetylase RimI-like enzyme
MGGQWRAARLEDEDAIVAMSLALYGEDPSPHPVSAAQVHATLERFRREPIRGRALVLDAGTERAGYAFLVSFWSNELAGEICTVDELYVAAASRNRGYATLLITSLMAGESLWPGNPVALELEVSPDNLRALALYERLGLRVKRNATMRLITRSRRPGIER